MRGMMEINRCFYQISCQISTV